MTTPGPPPILGPGGQIMPPPGPPDPWLFNPQSQTAWNGPPDPKALRELARRLRVMATKLTAVSTAVGTAIAGMTWTGTAFAQAERAGRATQGILDQAASAYTEFAKSMDDMAA